MEYNLIVILGSTASGKTRLAVKLARELGSEIISADSRQVYRGMNIGTGKDLSEYVVDGISVPFHLIDIVDFDHEFNVFEYQRRFFECFLEIYGRAILPIMVGGTGLYIESVLRGYRMLEVPENVSLRKEIETEDMEALAGRLLQLNPSVHNTTDLKDRKRLIRAIEIAEYSRNLDSEEISIPPIEPLVIGVRWEREILRRRITERLRKRLEEGMIEEVEGLLSSGISWQKLDFFGLEYRYIGLYLQRRLSYDEMFQKLNTRIHQFAKKQGTWFRRMEKQGIEIHWIDNADFNALRDLVGNLI
ncbi:MAG: tRNA (adenosine(37)-N6)-dimethylallyltransferase MiaA [Syntrophales bacterium]|nr:tRNA (adenosine(37)-N6)-dimethylallyltransferase MiaA [Syntrophales bacterium]